MFDSLLEIDLDTDEATLVRRITDLEILKSAAAANQARLTDALDTARRAREAAAGIPTARRGKGLGAEIALARRDSPHRGARHLGFARALVHDMPHTLAALQAGALTEWRAHLIWQQAACLTAADRATLDAELCADRTRLDGCGDKQITTMAKDIAYRLDPQAVRDRAARAPADRRVTLRPAPDAMCHLTALLPVEQGLAAFAALEKAAAADPDRRPRGHAMADTLVARLTGADTTHATPIAVDLVITDDTLFGGDPTPARVPGYGPIPATVARHLIGAALTDDRSAATLRRLYKHPATGALLSMESKARAFPKGLARFIALRDDTCRTPYCDAPIRHTDHATDHAHGGPTNATNGRGSCAACNYAKQAPGWHVTTTLDPHGRHHATFTTPTGAQHHSQAPPLPGPRKITRILIDAATITRPATRAA